MQRPVLPPVRSSSARSAGLSEMSRPSLRRRARLPLGLAALAIAPLMLGLSCREVPVPIGYLGVVDGGTFHPDPDYVPVDGGTDSSSPDTSVVAPPLTATDCANTLTLSGNPGDAISGFAALPDVDAVLIGKNGGYELHALDADGCPVADSAFQSVEVGKVASLQAFAGGVTLVAGSTGAGRVSSTTSGTVSLTCSLAARSILGTTADFAFVAAGTTTLQPISFTSTESVCDASPFTLTDPPVVLAPASAAGKGWVASLRVDASGSVPEIRRLTLATGTVDPSPVIDAGGALCGVDAIVENAGKLYVVDSGCSRVVAFDASSGATLAVHSTPGNIPRGLTLTSAGNLLLASASDAGASSTVTFTYLTP